MGNSLKCTSQSPLNKLIKKEISEKLFCVNYEKFIIKHPESTHTGSHIQIYLSETIQLINDDFCSYMILVDSHGAKSKELSSFVKHLLVELLSKTYLTLILLEVSFRKSLKSLNKILESLFSDLQRITESSILFKQYIETCGSFVTLCLFLKDKLFLCNLGASRSIIFSTHHENLNSNSIHIPTNLKEVCRSHTLDSPDEQLNIKENCGTALALQQSYSNRVYPYKNNFKNQSFTRSIGDLYCHSFGVSHLPEVQCVELNDMENKYLYLVCATSKMWEAMKPEVLQEIIVNWYDKTDTTLIENIKSNVEKSYFRSCKKQSDRFLKALEEEKKNQEKDESSYQEPDNQNILLKFHTMLEKQKSVDFNLFDLHIDKEKSKLKAGNLTYFKEDLGLILVDFKDYTKPAYQNCK